MTESEGGRVGIRDLDPFELFTPAEAEVFDGHLERKTLSAGEELPLEQSVVLVREGAVALVSGDSPALATCRVGGIAGELGLFEPEPVPLMIRAEAATDCYLIDWPSLKHGFRYSRPATVKWMIVFARALSQKLREVNDLVSKASPRAFDKEMHPSALSELDLHRLQSHSAHKTLEAGGQVFAEGDASGELYIIDQGAVDIERTSASGETIRLARLGPGDFFGEMSFVDQRPRSAHATATDGPLLVHVLPGGTLDRMIEQNLGVGIYVTDIICKIVARRLNVTLRHVLRP